MVMVVVSSVPLLSYSCVYVHAVFVLRIKTGHTNKVNTKQPFIFLITVLKLNIQHYSEQMSLALFFSPVCGHMNTVNIKTTLCLIQLRN